jgi:hypothetical protein
MLVRVIVVALFVLGFRVVMVSVRSVSVSSPVVTLGSRLRRRSTIEIILMIYCGGQRKFRSAAVPGIRRGKIFEQMVDAMRRGGGEKKDKEPYDAQGAGGAKVSDSLFHSCLLTYVQSVIVNSAKALTLLPKPNLVYHFHGDFSNRRYEERMFSGIGVHGDL